MLIDIVFLLMLGLGFFLGFRGGLIGAVFALVSLFIGGAVAVKFTSILTAWLYATFHISTQYLPFVVFLVLFIGVVLAVRGIGKLLEKVLEAASLGFVNRFLGGLLWCVVLTFLMSLFLWFSETAGLVSPELKTESYTYVYIYTAGPILLDFFGNMVPWFKGMFDVIRGTLDDMAA